MARINIEESLFRDLRFDDLKMKMGSVDTALGAMVRAWSLAQKWYLNEETFRLIPLSEWKKQRISDFIIEVGLAEVRENGVYVAGSEAQFAWLLQRQSAGKKGGRPSNQNKQEMAKAPDKVPVPPESGSNPLSLSLVSSSISFSSSNSNSSSENNTLLQNEETGKKRRVKVKPNTELNKKIWDAYSESYSRRYRVAPVRNESVNGKISQLGKRLGEEAIDVVKFYLTHNSSFYLTQMHPIGLCLKDAEGLRTQMLRGRAITTTDVREFEKQDHYTQQLKRLSEEG